MSIIAPNVDYTDKDFDALLARLSLLIRSAFPTWTDQNVADFGNILVELFCFVGDVLGFYQDNNAAESRIVTATQRKSLLSLCKLVGFTPPGAFAATVDLTFSIPAPAAAPVRIEAGDVFSTADATDALSFQLLESVVIPAGSTSVVGTVENSTNASDAFPSTGLANQELVLTAVPYVDGSAQVVAGDGAYVEVPNFAGSGASDKHFVVLVDQNDRARIRFGNASTGAVPTGTISVAYKVGGGAAGNAEPNTVVVASRAYTTTAGVPVQLRVTNPARAAGGRDRMSNEKIREQAPANVRAPVNSVAREDFTINAERLRGVARVLMLTRNEDPAVPENTGHLYVIPAGGGLPSQALKDAVHRQVTVVYPCTLTFNVLVLDPIYRAVNISVTVFKRIGYSATQCRAEIMEALGLFFAIELADGVKNPSVDFGANILDADGVPVQQLVWSDIFNVIRDLPSVRKIDSGPSGLLLNGIRGDASIGTKEFPQLGNVEIIDGDTGGAI